MKKAQQGRTKRQRAAEHKRAVAGGAAEAAKIRKQGPTKAQHKASLNWAKAGRAAQARARQHKAPVHPKVVKLSPGDVACCGPAALAASLRLWGAEVGTEDMLALYWRVAAGPDDGASLEDVLAAAAQCGMAGWYPAFRPLQRGEMAFGAVLGYADWLGTGIPHAVTWDGAMAVSWGVPYPLPGLADEAWALHWSR